LFFYSVAPPPLFYTPDIPEITMDLPVRLRSPQYPLLVGTQLYITGLSSTTSSAEEAQQYQPQTIPSIFFPQMHFSHFISICQGYREFQQREREREREREDSHPTC
jgi:hypothetical protein